jgi:FHA domain
MHATLFTVETPGSSRQRLASTLNAAYADGLISPETLSRRLDVLFGGRLVDPGRIVGDLTTRSSRRMPTTRLLHTARAWVRESLGLEAREPMLLALDWSGVQDELYVGRHASCDVRLRSPMVSRLHARLVFRDSCWIVQDLESRNGTAVNGKPVGRCRLVPGDDLAFADEHVRID